ncbi:MAG: carboxylating nicotinate-nucleotide diphosphorylase [Deltaproteobacteria bacterium]|nr:carboxylating nicotinate-nucleotide diphosphorylase [Deltaproteobacteria bacterium]
MDDIKTFISNALREDIGPGDLTVTALIPPDTDGKGELIAKEPLILAGIDVAREVFKQVDPLTSVTANYIDGDELTSGTVIASISGKLASLLTAERVALNLLQRLSGIATLTRQYVDRTEGTKASIVDTRKTTPGLRALEKYAVRIGGGKNHRFGLFDGILIKDNHIAAVGSLTEAVKRAREKAPHTLKIEVETENLDQVREAISTGAEIIMLDNMGIETMKEAVRLINRKALIEASGGINLNNVRQVAETGVDLISVGAITHSARSMDISMEITNA